MYKRLIKKYKYAGEGAVCVTRPGRVLKDKSYGSVDYDQFDPSAETLEKKKQGAADKSSLISEDHNPAGMSGKSSMTSPPAAGRDAKNEACENISSLDDAGKNHLEEKINARYEARLSTEKQASYKKGFDEGRQAGKADNEAAIRQLKQIVNSLKTEFESSRTEFFAEIERVAIDMSTHLARKIVGDAVYKVPEIVKTNVDKCVTLLAGSGTVQIKINPNDYEIVKSYLPELEQQFESKFSFVLEPDNHIEKGGCLVEFEGSVIDGRIDTQLDKIQKHMELLT